MEEQVTNLTEKSMNESRRKNKIEKTEKAQNHCTTKPMNQWSRILYTTRVALWCVRIMDEIYE